MPYKEKEIDKLYYSIGEIAAMFNVSTSLVRFWESEFDILEPKKGRGGTRKFTEKDIKNFRQIHYLVKEKGYTLDGAKHQLKDQRSGHTESVDVVESLQEIRQFLTEIKSNL